MGLDITKSNHHIKRMIEEHFLTEKRIEGTKYIYPLSELTSKKAVDDIPTSKLKPKVTLDLKESESVPSKPEVNNKVETSTTDETIPSDWNTASEKIDPTSSMPDKNDSVPENFTTIPSKSTGSNYEYPTVSFDSEDSKLMKLFKSIPRN